MVNKKLESICAETPERAITGSYIANYIQGIEKGKIKMIMEQARFITQEIVYPPFEGLMTSDTGEAVSYFYSAKYGFFGVRHGIAPRNGCYIGIREIFEVSKEKIESIIDNKA